MGKIKFFCLNLLLDIIDFFLSQIYKCKDCNHSECCQMEKGRICKEFSKFKHKHKVVVNTYHGVVKEAYEKYKRVGR